MKSLSYIEIDIGVCSLSYGVSPCTASIPTTGAIKCFNSAKTCQDREHYDEALVTLRFAVQTEYLPRDIDALPFIKSVNDISFSPATISLGENLGTRATLNVTLIDAPYSDTGEGFDKYLAERDYDPFKQGTFWGKFRARQPFLRGRSIRWITGLLGQSIDEMILQAGLCIWWDDKAQKVRFQVLRGVATDAANLTPDNTLQSSMTVKEQPDKRLSQVQVYFGQINPLKQLSDTDNYRSTSITIDEEAELDYGGAVIKTIYSRYIPALGRTVADRLGAILLSRFRDPPRKFTFDLQRYAGTDVALGAGYKVNWPCLQDATGARVDAPVQVTRLNPPADRFKCEAEEVLYSPPSDDALTHSIVIDSNTANINLRSVHDAIYSAPVSGITVVCRLLQNFAVFSNSPLLPAFDVGSWPSGVTIELIIEGNIRGAGGAGGHGKAWNGSNAQNGQNGGTALFTRQEITVEFPAGATIWGGGGGGGGGDAANQDRGYAGSGGGGAGVIAGPGGQGIWPDGAGSPGTEFSGGPGGPAAYNQEAAHNGGGGGGPGNPGEGRPTIAFGGTSGGDGGWSIDGFGYVEFTVGDGDARGPAGN